MKKTINLLALLFMTLSVTAQVPASDKDISPLLVSESIPSVQISTADGQAMDIKDVIKGKKSILLFYRGGWCPYCNAHLADIQKIEKEIKDLGWTVIAVSPDSPERLQKTSSEEKLDYAIISDANADLMKAMGIAFKGPEKYHDMFVSASGDLNKDGLLPVPSVFVVNEEGVIVFEYVSPDYSERISSGLLLGALKAL